MLGKRGNELGLLAASGCREGVGLDGESLSRFDCFPDTGERYFEDVDHIEISLS